MAEDLPDGAAERPVDGAGRGAGGSDGAGGGAYGAALDEMSELLREQARGWARQLRQVQLLAHLSRSAAASGVAQFAQLEMAGSWQVSQLTATRWLWEAQRLHDALPRTLAMLDRGALLVHQAVVLLHRTRHCPVEVAQAVEAVVLPAGAGLCPADLARRVERAVLRIEAEQAGAAAAEQRHADAAATRRTFAKPLPDGLGLAGAVLTAEQLVGWQAGMADLERRERRADRDAGVDRSSAQRRADLFAALPAMVLAGTAQDRSSQTGAGGGGLRPWTLGPAQLAAQVVLHVHVPVATVLELSHAPGSLDRYGPLSAEHVRLLRPHSWRRVLVDAASGRPIALDDRPRPVPDDPHTQRQQLLALLRPDLVVDADEVQHDPSARLARLIDLRDVHCCGPGCSASHTHRDHLVPHPTGPTSARNLGRHSPRCHRAKHTGWTLVRHPDGSTTWTSPLGRTYTRPSPHDPPPHVDLTDPPPPHRPHPPAAAPARDDRLLTPDQLTPPAQHHDRPGNDDLPSDRGVPRGGAVPAARHWTAPDSSGRASAEASCAHGPGTGPDDNDDDPPPF